MQSWIHLKNLLNLFLQSHCPLCERDTSNCFCQYCNQQLQSCQQKHPHHQWKPPLPIFAWGDYRGTLKTAIAKMKYENQPQIGYTLGEYLGKSWLLNLPIPDKKLMIVPIPLHPNKQKQRGYNQAELIAQGFCTVTGFKLKTDGLARIKETEAQFKLSPFERENNLLNAFELGKGFVHRHPQTPILLLDDIYTTGATAKSAVNTLRQSGMEVLGLAAVASTLKSEKNSLLPHPHSVPI